MIVLILCCFFFFFFFSSRRRHTRCSGVSWARGCGHQGRVSPPGGRAKLPWNLEWAAKWGLLGVTIEGCGKDLATAGGSRDRSDAISREVFEVEPPRNVTYEFLNIRAVSYTHLRAH